MCGAAAGESGGLVPAVLIMDAPLPTFHRDSHVRFVHELDRRADTIEYWLSEQLKLNGMYWGACTLALLGALPQAGSPERQSLVDFVLSCASESGDAFGGNVMASRACTR